MCKHRCETDGLRAAAHIGAVLPPSLGSRTHDDRCRSDTLRRIVRRPRPADYIDGNDELRAVLDLIAGGTFSHGDTEVFRPLVDNLRYDDPFLVCADYASYVDCQQQVSAAWQDRDSWTKKSILNTARSGKFSSDRAIAEYCDDIWKVWPLTVTV
ncbi:MAG: glycogen phosphorylase [Mycobacterium sp.]|nr:glycogen phosphorylase [Mycobacterium sp.]